MKLGDEMLTDGILSEFIKTLEQFSENDIEVSILELSGGIIYSTNKKRFHYDGFEQRVKEFKDSEHISCHINQQDGILTTVLAGGKPLVYIMLVGSKKEIKPLALVLKMAMEIRMKYDEEEHKNKEERTLNGRIMRELLESSMPNKTLLKELFQSGNYLMEIPRILLVLESDNRTNKEIIENTNYYFDSVQDIVTIYNDNIFIWKDCTKSAQNDRIYIQQYINHIRENTVLKGKVFITERSTQIGDVSRFYAYVKWMKEYLAYNFLYEHIKNFFFRDYFDIYMMSKISISVYEQMYLHVLEDKEFNQEEFLDIIHVLIRNNYNLTQSSKELFMHRNTILYKLEKLKKILNIDPVNKEEDRFFLKGLCYFLMIKKGREGNHV